MNEEQKKRVDQFLTEYGALVEKYKVDFATYPMFVPDKEGSFKVVVQTTPMDTTDLPKKSPFITQ